MNIKRFHHVAAFNKWNIAENENDVFCYCDSKSLVSCWYQFFRRICLLFREFYRKNNNTSKDILEILFDKTNEHSIKTDYVQQKTTFNDHQKKDNHRKSSKYHKSTIEDQ